MRIFNEIEPFRAFLAQQRTAGKSIGFVPTMGALHQGHMQLIRTSKADNHCTVCSIFVNPTQFNNPADLAKYPRTVESDSHMLTAEGCDVLFLPPVSEMYPSSDSLSFQLGRLDQILEGKFRPGHFSGVALVVSKLFNILLPDKAYFGQKDFQQVRVVNKLVNDLNFNIKIVVVPTMRESDGLAMSSRNLRLTPEQRSRAAILFQSLTKARHSLLAGNSFETVRAEVKRTCDSARDVALEYVELAEAENLNSLERVDGKARAVLLIAAFVGEVRLIDNLLIDEN